MDGLSLGTIYWIIRNVTGMIGFYEKQPE